MYLELICEKLTQKNICADFSEGNAPSIFEGDIFYFPLIRCSPYTNYSVCNAFAATF